MKVSKKSIQYLNSLIATRTAKSRYVDDMRRVELYKDRKITTEREAALTITRLLSGNRASNIKGLERLEKQNRTDVYPVRMEKIEAAKEKERGIARIGNFVKKHVESFKNLKTFYITGYVDVTRQYKK